MKPEVLELVATAARRPGGVVVLTGAGVSAASGIPTFRGPEGYWSAGSAVHTPEELATRAMFVRRPDVVWAWYLHRLAVCRAAAPNAAHIALVRLEDGLGDRFRLLTQNVDGLHRRAGSTPARTYPVHGDISLMRCVAECPAGPVPVPADLDVPEPAAGLPDAVRDRLVCPGCGGPARPHVLWFDETYDERYYRFDSALAAARDAALLVTAGTSGATTLPALVVRTAVGAGATLVDVNPEPGPFGELADRLPAGAAVRAPATEALPALVAAILRGSGVQARP